MQRHTGSRAQPTSGRPWSGLTSLAALRSAAASATIWPACWHSRGMHSRLLTCCSSCWPSMVCSGRRSLRTRTWRASERPRHSRHCRPCASINKCLRFQRMPIHQQKYIAQPNSWEYAFHVGKPHFKLTGKHLQYHKHDRGFLSSTILACGRWCRGPWQLVVAMYCLFRSCNFPLPSATFLACQGPASVITCRSIGYYMCST